MNWIKKRLLYIFIGIFILVVGVLFTILSLINDIPNSIKNTIFLSVGTSIIASGVVYFIDIIRQYVDSNISSKILSIIEKGGISEVYKKRDLDKYDDLMNGLKISLDIVGYSLNAFYESYEEILKTRCMQYNNLKIRILVVDPESEFSKHRERIEGNAEGKFKNSLERLVRELGSIENIEIKKISAPLSTMIFRIDNIMFVGPHLYKKSSKATMTLELYDDGWLFKEYQSEFDEMWKDARNYKEII